MLLVGDGAMRRLNREALGRDYPTDVLSFPQFEPEEARVLVRGEAARRLRRGEPPLLLGDIVLNVHAAARQAEELNASIEEEMDRLLIHGALHLMGYDHETGGAEAARMRRRERLLARKLARIGSVPNIEGRRDRGK